MKLLLAVAPLLAFAAVNPVFAAGETAAHDHAHAGTQVSTAKAGPSEGTVKKVDKTTGKITIKHGPLANLGMPPMTMAFAVGDPAMLDKVKAGDKVHFTADQVGDALTVTELETTK
ncbi:MAG TPA: copper-binding protein [Candidatus Accumulibacter phosphatis]|nr:copper-binding protein [Candidatus Accumulibacter phosphatis]